MKNNIKAAFHLLFPLWLIALLMNILTACNSSDSAQENSAEGELTEPSSYAISKAQATNIKLVIEELKAEKVKSEVMVSGSIDVPPGSITAYNFPIPVYISELEVYEGSFVKKGKHLFTIAHPELVALQKSLIAANSQLSSTKAEWNRQKELFAKEATAGKRVAESEANYRNAEASFLDIKSKLENMGLRPGEVLQGKTSNTIRIFAKQDGVVGGITVKNNSLVPMQTTILQLTDVTHKHLELLVPEVDGEKIVEGQQVEFVLLTNQSKQMKGHIYLTSKEIDRNSGLMNIHAHLENENDPLLKPGAAVKASINLGETIAFRLPVEAVVEYKAVPHIFELISNQGDSLSFKLFPIKAKKQEGFFIFEDNKALLGKKIVTQNADFLFTKFLQGEDEE